MHILPYTVVFILWFHQRIEEILDQHDPKQPLFLYMAFQNVHNPIQAPDQYVDKFSFIHQKMRRVHAGMVAVLDEAVGNITKMFKKKGWVSYQFPWRFHILILLWAWAAIILDSCYHSAGQDSYYTRISLGFLCAKFTAAVITLLIWRVNTSVCDLHCSRPGYGRTL